MSNRYKVLDQRGLNYLTLTVKGWVDVFSRKCYRDIIIDSLEYCINNKGLHVYGYVIMTNHIHLIVSVSGKQTLSEVIGDMKSFTAKEILKTIKTKPESRREWLLYLFRFFAKGNKQRKEFQFWDGDNHPIDLYSKKVILQKLNYCHFNPIRAGWVRMAQHYIYSSASNYLEDGSGVLKVELLEEYFEPF